MELMKPAELIKRLDPADPAPPVAAKQLTNYAVELRYAAPEAVTTLEAATALKLAEDVLEWARKRLAVT